MGTIKSLIIVVVIFVTTAFTFDNATLLKIGKKVPIVEISGDEGGFFNSEVAWKSEILERNKPSILIYVDPDKEKEVDLVRKKILANGFKYKLQIFVIINMKSTWKPDFAIEKRVKERQKQNDAIKFVLDQNNVLHENWKLIENENTFVFLDKNGIIQFVKLGKFSNEEADGLIELIKKELANN